MTISPHDMAGKLQMEGSKMDRGVRQSNKTSCDKHLLGKLLIHCLHSTDFRIGARLWSVLGQSQLEGSYCLQTFRVLHGLSFLGLRSVPRLCVHSTDPC